MVKVPTNHVGCGTTCKYDQIFISYIQLQLTSCRKHHVSLKLDVKMLPQQLQP